jgi:hypothetical protein
VPGLNVGPASHLSEGRRLSGSPHLYRACCTELDGEVGAGVGRVQREASDVAAMEVSSFAAQ